MRMSRRAWWALALTVAVVILGRRRRTPTQRAEDLRWRWM